MMNNLLRLWGWIVVNHWGKFVVVCGMGMFGAMIWVFAQVHSVVEQAEKKAREASRAVGALSEILHNTFDDGRSSVYIKVDRPTWHKVEESIEELVNKKREWEREAHGQRIVTTAIVYGPDGSKDAIYGLLLHYEPR